MKKRVILLFPQLTNMEMIKKICFTYNSDYKFIDPHICLVFPFDSELTNIEIARNLDSVLKNFKLFDIECRGFTKSLEGVTNYVFLEVTKGKEVLGQISTALYKELKDIAILYKEYIPHITVAKVKSIEELNDAFNFVSQFNDVTFNSTIDTIHGKIITQKEDGTLIIEDEYTYYF